jgi:hypothetical protein
LKIKHLIVQVSELQHGLISQPCQISSERQALIGKGITLKLGMRLLD